MIEIAFLYWDLPKMWHFSAFKYLCNLIPTSIIFMLTCICLYDVNVIQLQYDEVNAYAQCRNSMIRYGSQAPTYLKLFYTSS